MHISLNKILQHFVLRGYLGAKWLLVIKFISWCSAYLWRYLIIWLISMWVWFVCKAWLARRVNKSPLAWLTRACRISFRACASQLSSFSCQCHTVGSRLFMNVWAHGRPIVCRIRVGLQKCNFRVSYEISISLISLVNQQTSENVFVSWSAIYANRGWYIVWACAWLKFNRLIFVLFSSYAWQWYIIFWK